MKWLEKIFIIIAVIILLPFIVFIFICYLIALPFIAISDRINYKKSPYYKEFKIKFNNKIIKNPNYIFYNYIVNENLNIKYVKEESNSFEYFIYNNEILILPDFNELQYNEELNQYETVTTFYSEEYRHTLDEYYDKKKNLITNANEMEIKLLIFRTYFEELKLDLQTLPNYVTVIRNYEHIIEKEDDEIISLMPSTTIELYEMMKRNKKLGGKIEIIDNELIIWSFEKVNYEISVDINKCYFTVNKNNKLKTEITHWHPDYEEIYDEICKIGEVGNILVIKKFLGTSRVLFIGEKEKCKYNLKRKTIARLYCFESK